MPEEKTEMVEQPQEPQNVTNEEIKEQPEDKFEVKGNDIIINGEKYEPERALELIKKQRQFEKDLEQTRSKLQTFEQLEEQRKREQLSEIDRLKLEKQEAEQRLAQLTQEKQRHDIARKVNLPEGLIDRIKGESPEEMEQDALKLLESLPKPGAPKTSATNPGAVAEKSWKEPRIDPFDPSFVKGHGGGVFTKQ